MNNELAEQERLQASTVTLLNETPILSLLALLGTVTQTGSSTTGLMAYPDIDFAVQHENPNVNDAFELLPRLRTELAIKMVKVADFSDDEGESASYYLGFDVYHDNMVWHIDATVGRPGPVGEAEQHLRAISTEQRQTIIRLKKQLIHAGRYVGARSTPPYTFRSFHVYEAVLDGHATSVDDLESYYKRSNLQN